MLSIDIWNTALGIRNPANVCLKTCEIIDFSITCIRLTKGLTYLIIKQSEQQFKSKSSNLIVPLNSIDVLGNHNKIEHGILFEFDNRTNAT